MVEVDIVEEVKRKNLIEDVVAEDGFTLPQRGRYRKCTVKGIGGLVVDTQKQSYHWNTKGEWGDVVNWVMVQRRMDFKGAVGWLASRAHLPEPEWGHANAQVRLAARAREDALEVATRVFAGWLEQSAEAMVYAQRRGWTTWDATGEERKAGSIQLARLGYSGVGSPAEREEMRQALSAGGVDLNSPVAVAIVGYKGNVAAWAHEHGINIEDVNADWVTGGYIPGMVGRQRLVYAHVRNGRVVYLSGRSIVEKLHYNVPEILVGKRQVYLNHEYAPGAKQVIVVEGQADAVSLAQLGLDAVALAGVAAGDELADLLEKHAVVYVGLDSDEAGRRNAWRVCDVLPPATRLVNWAGSEHPAFRDSEGENRIVKDANDLLRALVQSGVTDPGAEARKLLENAPTYVEAICEWAGEQKGSAQDEAIQEALKVVARLEEFQYSLYRVKLAKSLKITTRELANMLKTLAAAVEEKQAEGEPVFTFGDYVNGWLLEYLYDPEHDRSMLAWRDPEGHIAMGDSVVINGYRYLPEPPNNTIRRQAILFPTKLGELKSVRELVAYVEMYVNSVYILPSPRMARLVSYYVLLTWVYDMFETVMYLRAMGSAGSGKSELMRRVGLVCYRTMAANGAGSTSSLFRAVERYKCSVFIDEADIQGSDTENDMIKFYNLGAMRGNPIWRTEKVVIDGRETFEEIGFQTFCPKLVAMRKDFRDDAVGSRSLTLKLQPRETLELVTAGISLTITEQMRERAQALRNLLARWRMHTWQPTVEVDPTFYDLSISARLNQVAGPLLALAREDPEQQEEIRKTLREYYAESILSQSMTLAARVIEALWKIYKYPDLHMQMVKREADGSETIKIGDVTRITNEIMDEMNGEEEEAGDDDKKKGGGQGVKAQRIGRILREELQLQVTERRRDGFSVFWNGTRLTGLAMRFGVKPETVGPDVGVNGNGAAPKVETVEVKPVQEGLL